jgi:Fe-S-cluster containining protein
LRFNCNKCGLCCGDTKQKTRRILLLEYEKKCITLKTSRLVADFSLRINGKLPYVYEMKKTNEGKCVFLKENQCTIYSIRPLICMFYPFELKFDISKEKYVFDFTLECPQLYQGRELNGQDFKKMFEIAKKRLLRVDGEHRSVPK